MAETVNDTVVPGLALRVFPTYKAYYLFYRTKEGRQRRPKIGDAKIITLAQARQIAKAMLLQVAMGKDPMLERHRAQDAPTVNALADRYWERYGKNQKASRDVKRHLDRYIRRMLGSTRVCDVTYPDCERLHDMVADQAPIQANRVIATFSAILKQAERWGMRPLDSNPCKRVRRTTEKARRRFMTPVEAQRIAAALRGLEALYPAGVAFIYLLILSGARCGEIAAARWEWIDDSVLTLQDSKTGFRQIHLPPQVLALLAKLPRTSGTLTGLKHPPDRLWQKVRDLAGCPDLRLHDLRRSFASAALSAGLTLAQVGELLGHRNSQTTKGYSYLMKDAATAAVSVVADKLTAMMRPAVTSEPALPLLEQTAPTEPQPG